MSGQGPVLVQQEIIRKVGGDGNQTWSVVLIDKEYMHTCMPSACVKG